MTALQQLETYLKHLEQRLRLLAFTQGFSISAISAFALTVLLVWIGNRYRFAAGVVLPLRILLLAGVACVVTAALAIPVMRINRRRSVRLAETRINDLGQRLLTISEKADAGNPFTELLAEDALRVVQASRTEQLTPKPVLYGSIVTAVLAVAALLWIILAGPGYWGYGSSLLWTGTAHASSRPLYDIAVQPGNKTVRRRSDQIISAQLLGFSSQTVLLHAKYHDAAKWDIIPMQPHASGTGYQVLFAGLSDSLEYYVQAGNTTSKHFTVAVKDLPAVKRIRVALHYPSGLGLTDTVEDPGGDVRAVEGSQAQVSVLTDKPLTNGLLVLENGSKVSLAAGQDGWVSANLPISKDGSYHVAALDGNETVRISDDYFIESKKDEPPSVRISHPGRDPHVSPIEEVPVTVEAADDFGIKTLQLHYSVNGGPEQVAQLARRANAKEAQGKTTLYFENFNLVPGDLVSFYATATDASHTSRSDIVFAQAEPFDFKFRQSQQAGGAGGGSGAEQGSNISARQKEIIAATWNELKDPNKDHATVAEHARFLSDLEGKLGDQAKALAARMGSRDLGGTNPEFAAFSKAMTQAAEDMTAAQGQLSPGKWNIALPPEQKALQSLLRAESIFRDIQVAYGQRGGGGGAAAGGEERELARLFDLELDNSKNQYETGQSASMGGAEQQKQIDDALQRLKDLAKRQQELAQQQHAADQQFQQRWEEEQLRREAEELRQQMRQLSQQAQAQQGQSQQSESQSSRSSQSSSSQSSQSSQSGRAGQQSSASSRASSQRNQQALRQAMDQLKRAEDEMRNAVTNHDASAQSRAGEQLAQAQESLRNMLHQQAGNSVADLAQRARELAQSQADLANRIKRSYGMPTSSQQMAGGESASEMPEMEGPDYAGGWYRRRLMQGTGRAPTNQEKELGASAEKLSQQMQQLQEQLQKQAAGISTEQPQAARRLRKAASDAEQEELALRMQKGSEWLREGYGIQTVPLQDSITAGVQQLSRQLAEAQQAVNDGKQAGPGSEDDKMLEALSKVQSMREQLEREQSQREQQNGSQAQRGQEGSMYSPKGGGAPSVSHSTSETNGLDDLYSMRSQLGRNDRQLNNSLENAIGALRRVQSQRGLLDARINQDAVASLERLELELARRADWAHTGARTNSPESAPEQYREALAEYFRELSK